MMMWYDGLITCKCDNDRVTGMAGSGDNRQMAAKIVICKGIQILLEDVINNINGDIVIVSLQLKKTAFYYNSTLSYIIVFMPMSMCIENLYSSTTI